MSRQISTRISLDGEAEYRAAVKSINSELTVLKSELAVVESEFQGEANSLDALTKKHEKLRQQYELQARKLKELNKMQGEAEAVYKSLQGRLEEAKIAHGETSEEVQALTEAVANAKSVWDKYATQANRAEAELNKLDTQLEKNNQYMDEARQSADGCAVSIDEFGKKVKQAGKNAEEAGGQSKIMGDLVQEAASKAATAISVSGFIALLGQIASGLNECADSAAKFDTGMAKVQTLAGSELAASMKDEILAVSSQLGVAATSVADAVYNAISAGVDPTRAVDFTASALQLAKGGFTEAATAVDVLTTALNAYGLSVDDVNMVSDRLITTQNKGKTTVDELAGQIGKAIPVAAAYNVNLDNLATSLAIMTANGTGTAESVTNVKSMISELGDSGSTVAGILKEKTGKSFADLMESGSSLGEVLNVLYSSVGNNTTEFGDLWSNSTALMAALSLLSAGAEGFNDMLQEMANSEGAAADAAEVMADTYEETSARLATAWENFKIHIGDNVAPAKQKVQEFFIDILETISSGQRDLEERIQAIVSNISNLERDAFAADHNDVTFDLLAEQYKKLLDALNVDFDMTAYSTPADALNDLRAAAQQVMPDLEETISGINGLTGAASGALLGINEMTNSTVGLGASMGLTTQASDSFNQSLAEQAKNAADIEQAQEPLIESMTALIDSYNDAYDSAYSSISGQLGLFNDLSAETSLSIDDMIATLEKQVSYMDTYADNIQRAMELGVDKGLIAKLSDGSEESAGILQEIVDAGEDKIAELNEKFAQVEEGKNTFSETIGLMMSDAEEQISQFISDYSDDISELDQKDKALEAGKNTVLGLVQGIESMEGAVQNALARVASLGHQAYKDEDEQASPSRAMRRIGVYTMQGLVDGIKSMESALKEEMAQVADDAAISAIDTLKTRTSDLVKAYESAYSSAYRAIDGKLGLFNEISAADSKPLEDMLSALDVQLEYVSVYNENLQKALSMGLDAGLISELSDGSAESAGMLQEIVNSSEEAIAELNEKFAAVREGKEDFADTVAAMESGFDEEMRALVADFDAAVADMDMYDEAFLATQSTMEGMLDGVDSLSGSVISEFAALARDAVDAYNAELANALADIAAVEETRATPDITDMRELMAGVVNGIQTAVTGTGGDTIPLTINLQTGDARPFAEWILPDLIQAANAAGTPIASGQYA